MQDLIYHRQPKLVLLAMVKPFDDFACFVFNLLLFFFLFLLLVTFLIFLLLFFLFFL